MFPTLRVTFKKRLINLYSHQEEAVKQLKTGSILCGGVGSGKSLTALTYYITVECDEMRNPKDLVIITTAQKRDKLEWERECTSLRLSTKKESGIGGTKVYVDSWNNIHKYTDIKGAFFIFDEQRLVGSGSWVKSFLKIVKNNSWILLSATPGDTWMDYIPVFIANGFYKNRTEFLRMHVVYNNFTKFPKVDHYVECGRLIRFKQAITVNMLYQRPTISHQNNVLVEFDKEKFDLVSNKKWNPYTNEPITNISNLCYIMRKVVNSDSRRIEAVKKLITKHPKVIIFYNFNYELDLLKELKENMRIDLAEYNGHKHENIPNSDRWVYLVQYTSGAEGWNCILTDTIIFYSQNYSYRTMTQAAGRIDRLNTPFKDLYYYHIHSASAIDFAIAKAIRNKKDFNENSFAKVDI